MKNMATSLVLHKRINTTLAKAKALRVFLEPLITKSKENTVHNRRVIFSYLQSKEAIKELFGTIAQRIGDRPGGYLRVIKSGFRRSDAAEMAMIEFVDFNEVYVKAPKGESSDSVGTTAKKSTRRGRRRGGKQQHTPTSSDTQGSALAAATTATTAAAANISQEEE